MSAVLQQKRYLIADLGFDAYSTCMLKKNRFLSRIVGSVAAILIICGFAAFVLRVVDKVRTGHGLDYYFTGWGVQFNYIGVLILLILAPIAMLVGWGIRWWQLRDERDFRKRFNLPKDPHDSLNLDE